MIGKVPSVLFVCRGNFCRSPMAQGAFALVSKRAGIQARCDSAGIEPEFEGSALDWRAQMVARRNGVDISGQRSRRVEQGDFARFGLILAMDRHVVASLRAMAPKGAGAQVALMYDLVRGREGKSLRDPYSGNVADFFDCWREIDGAMREVVARISMASTT
jgi:protein-tyrosine phosphatase